MCFQSWSALFRTGGFIGDIGHPAEARGRPPVGSSSRAGEGCCPHRETRASRRLAIFYRVSKRSSARWDGAHMAKFTAGKILHKLEKPGRVSPRACVTHGGRLLEDAELAFKQTARYSVGFKRLADSLGPIIGGLDWYKGRGGAFESVNFHKNHSHAADRAWRFGAQNQPSHGDDSAWPLHPLSRP